MPCRRADSERRRLDRRPVRKKRVLPPGRGKARAMANLSCDCPRRGPPMKSSSTRRAGSDPAEPVKTLLAVVGVGKVVGDLHRGDPLRVLEPDLGGRAQAKRKPEGIGDRL